MAKRYFERHSLATALGTSLSAWSVAPIKEGYQGQDDIQPPMVSIVFLPSNYLELQLGRSVTSEKTFTRRVQIDCYMETEARAMTIGDDIMEFLDQMYINIVNPSGTILGHLYVPNSESITADTLHPRVAEPRVVRWREVVTATLEADYIV